MRRSSTGASPARVCSTPMTIGADHFAFLDLFLDPFDCHPTTCHRGDFYYLIAKMIKVEDYRICLSAISTAMRPLIILYPSDPIFPSLGSRCSNTLTSASVRAVTMIIRLSLTELAPRLPSRELGEFLGCLTFRAVLHAAEGPGFEPGVPVAGHTRFPSVPDKPLWHPS